MKPRNYTILLCLALSGCMNVTLPVTTPVQTPVIPDVPVLPVAPAAPTGLTVGFVKDATGNLIANGDAPWAVDTNAAPKLVTPPALPGMAARVMVQADVAMVATPQLVTMPAAEPNVTISWDARTDVDGFSVNIGGQVQMVAGTVSSLDAWVPTNQPTRIYVADFMAVPSVVTGTVQGHTIYITNAVTASAPAMALYCPPGTLDVTYVNGFAVITFAMTPGVFVKVQSSDEPAGPFTDTGWQLTCNGSSNFTFFPLPTFGKPQQFYRLHYGN